MKTYRGGGGIAPRVDLGTRRRWVVSFRSDRFNPRERVHGTHWIWCWVGPRVSLDAVNRRKIPSPSRESNPGTPIVQPVASRYTDWATQGSENIWNIISFAFIFCVPYKTHSALLYPLMSVALGCVLEFCQNPFRQERFHGGGYSDLTCFLLPVVKPSAVY
jgi:hypothetical protein